MAGKKNKNSELSETKRHFGVIATSERCAQTSWFARYPSDIASKGFIPFMLEHIDSKVKLVLEGHRGLEIGFNKKFDQVNEKLDALTGQVNMHSGILKEHGGILKEHSGILNAHTEMFRSMQADIEVIKIDSAFIKNSLKQKVGLDEFAVLEKRVAMLERKLQRT